jgi:hypothetical protein
MPPHSPGIIQGAQIVAKPSVYFCRSPSHPRSLWSTQLEYEKQKFSRLKLDFFQIFADAHQPLQVVSNIWDCALDKEIPKFSPSKGGNKGMIFVRWL